ncbi:MAG TPA: phosphotransferase, partial [Dehalococcoidia bacterium]|nr:phosphotransferase [Dehalococcoidia bacterium]
GWHALLLEDLGPKTVPPWSAAAARGVMQAFAAFHAATRQHALLQTLPPPADYAGDFAGCWRRLLDRAELPRVAMLAGPEAAAAEAWLGEHAATLSRTALALAEAPPPYVLLHGDLRSDNLRWRGGRLRRFDWPHLGAGPAEFDVAATAQSITVEGGPEPERLLGWYGERTPLRPAVVDAAVAAVAGFFAELAWQPELPGLPRLRAFQRAQLRVTLRWAAARLGLPEPAWLAAVPV